MSHSYDAPTRPPFGFSAFGAVAGVVERMRQRRELAAARRGADRDILRHRLPSLRHSWRIAELVAPKNRLELARTIRTTVADAQQRYALNARPVNRRAVRNDAERLLALGDRLADIDRPVEARGVLLAQHLLSEESSPVYDPTRPEALPFYVDAALEALEPR